MIRSHNIYYILSSSSSSMLSTPEAAKDVQRGGSGVDVVQPTTSIGEIITMYNVNFTSLVRAGKKCSIQEHFCC